MYSARARLLFAIFAFALLSGASASRRALPQDAYIWQRKWTPALRVALKQSPDLVRAWRVLAAYSDDGGRLQAVAVDWKALKSSGRPVIAVVRINGQLARYNDDRLLGDLDGLLSRWRQMSTPIAGLEIDHDCGSARLAAYAKFLARVRAHLDHTIPLSITALPAWLSSPELDAVFAPTSEVVLQVHMVQNPRAGLFDPVQARRWIQEMSHRTDKPFRVALPAYGVRVTWRGDGSMLAVESEEPLLAGGYSASEMIVSPEAVSGAAARPRTRRAGLAYWNRMVPAPGRRRCSRMESRDLARGGHGQAIATTGRGDRRKERDTGNEQYRTD